MFPALLVLFCYIFFWPVATHVTVFFHELGHSMAALWFTKEPVEMYVGTYGNKAQSRQITIGRLQIYLENKSFLWNKGLCVPRGPVAREWQAFLLVLAGPLFSLLFGAALWMTYRLHSDAGALLWKILPPIFIFSAVYDFLRNLFPDEEPIYIEGHTITYNDGYQLREILFRREQRQDFKRAAALFGERQYAESGRLFERLAAGHFRTADTIRYSVAAYRYAGEPEKALTLARAETVDNPYQRPAHQIDLGLLHSLAGRHEEALGIYRELLEKNPEDAAALANVGFTLIVQEQYDEARTIFEKLLAGNPEDAYTLSQIGLIQYRRQGAPAGLPEMEKAATATPENAYILRNLAIYHFEQGNKAEAKSLFEKALELDPSVYEGQAYLRRL